jgi:hypothetical protein
LDSCGPVLADSSFQEHWLQPDTPRTVAKDMMALSAQWNAIS